MDLEGRCCSGSEEHGGYHVDSTIPEVTKGDELLGGSCLSWPTPIPDQQEDVEAAMHGILDTDLSRDEGEAREAFAGQIGSIVNEEIDIEEGNIFRVDESLDDRCKRPVNSSPLIDNFSGSSFTKSKDVNYGVEAESKFVEDHESYTVNWNLSGEGSRSEQVMVPPGFEALQPPVHSRSNENVLEPTQPL